MRHPAALPETWELATIDEVTSYVQRGKSPAYAEKSDLPVVNQKCIRWNGVDPQWLKFVDPAQWRQWGEERFLQLGDVLWNSTGTGTIGRAALFRGLAGYERAVVDSHVTILRTRDYSPALLHYWIMSPAVQAKLDRMQAGSTNQVELSRAEVLATQVAVPPLPEQQRIVDAIESYLTRLDNAVALLERVEQNLKRYRASVLKAAVEGRLVPTEAELARREGRSYEPASELLKRILAERKTRWIEDAAEKARAKAEEKARKAAQPWTAADDAATLEKEHAKAAKQYKEPAASDTADLPELPEGWCWTTLAQIKLFSLYGPRFSSELYVSDGYLVVRTSDISSTGRVDTEQAPRLRLSREEFQSFSILRGDLLITRTGSLGTLAVFDDDVEAIPGAYLIQYRLAAPRTTSAYCACVLQSPAGQRYLRGSGAGIGRPNLNAPTIERFPIPLPPLAEQERILLQVGRCADGMERWDAALRLLERRFARLRQSILKWAFEGRLVEQDPNDEPASALLERIRAERAAAGAPKARGRRRRSSE